MALVLVAGACTGDRTPQTVVGAGTASRTAVTTARHAPATFGDLPSPCGPGDATGTTDQGVTDDKIVIGYGDDAGFSVLPGLDHEIGDAVRAIVKWCNEQGGINGRAIDARYYDARFTDAVNVVQDACRQVFMLVGQGWANDAAEEPTRIGCNLPEVPGFVVSATNVPLMVQGLPNPVDVNSSTWARQLAEAFPDKVKKAAVLYGNVPASIDSKDKVIASFPKFGWRFLDCSLEWNVLGEADWRPFAQKLEECGAEMVNFIGPPYPNFENLLDAAALSDYRPIWFADVNNYDPNLARWNTAGHGDQLYVRLPFVPFEEARDNKAIRQYIDLVQQNGGDIAPLGVQATSGFLLWATAAERCGSILTRRCVMDDLKRVTAWTAGGLHAATNPGGNLGPECGVLVKLQGTKYVRFAPKRVNTFDCAPGDNVEIPRTARVVAQARLGPDRVSTKYGK